MEQKDRVTYYLDTAHENSYISYDRRRRTATYHGHTVQMSEDALLAFLHTAEMIGFKTGKI